MEIKFPKDADLVDSVRGLIGKAITIRDIFDNITQMEDYYATWKTHSIIKRILDARNAAIMCGEKPRYVVLSPRLSAEVYKEMGDRKYIYDLVICEAKEVKDDYLDIAGG